MARAAVVWGVAVSASDIDAETWDTGRRKRQAARGEQIGHDVGRGAEEDIRDGVWRGVAHMTGDVV